MKRKLAILGLIGFSAWSGFAYEVDIYDIHFGHRYNINSLAVMTYGNNLVFTMNYYGGEHWDQWHGMGLLFYDLAYQRMKIIAFGDENNEHQNNNIVIESYWPDLGRTGEACIGYGSFETATTYLWVGTKAGADSLSQVIAGAAPEQNRAMDSALPEKPEALTGATAGDVKREYLFRILAPNYDHSFFYIFYVYGQIYAFNGYGCCPLITTLYINNNYVGTTDGLLFFKFNHDHYVYLIVTSFANSKIESFSITDPYFSLQTANENYLILHDSNEYTVNLRFYYQ